MYTSDEWKKKLSTCLYVTAKNMPHPHPFHPQPAWNGQIHVLAHSAGALHWVAGHNWALNEPMIQSSSPGRHKTRVLAKSWWEWCKLTNLCDWNDTTMFHHGGTPQIISIETSVLYRSWPKLSQVDNVLDKEHRGLKALIPTIRVFRMIWWLGMVTTSVSMHLAIQIYSDLRKSFRSNTCTASLVFYFFGWVGLGLTDQWVDHCNQFPLYIQGTKWPVRDASFSIIFVGFQGGNCWKFKSSS